MQRQRADIQGRFRSARRRLGQALVLAILTHLAILPLMSGLVPPSDPTPNWRVRLVTLGKANPANAAKRRLQQQEASRKKDTEEEKKKEEKKEEKELTGQIVDIPPTADNEAPDEADYLSEHNTRTEKETRSRHQAPDYKNSMNEPAVEEITPPRPLPGDEHRTTALVVGPDQDPAHARQEKGQDRAFELPEIGQRDRLTLALDPEFGRRRNQASSDPLHGQGDQLRLSLGPDSLQDAVRPSAPASGPPMAALVPDFGVLARIGGGPANDHLDLEEGEGTFLNSREFRFASFFNRMKRGVSQHWQPLVEYRRRDPTGNIYGQRARVTVLNVTLNNDGSVKNLEVEKSSGVDFLDHEAVLAFRRAEPFPNPPKGLMDERGDITFPFGFHIEFSAGSGVRLPF